MQLIDALEARFDSVKLIESVVKTEANCDESGNWWLILDDAGYPISQPAFEELLNLLRIPIKYIHRCVAEDGRFLAEASINYWMDKYGALSFIVSGAEPTITQVFPSDGLYLPSVKVNDLIIDYLGFDRVKVHSFNVQEDIFTAVYVTDEVVEIRGVSYNLGVRVLYSDCFTITPRFDGVIVAEDGAIFGWPTLGRKFRVAANTIPQVIAQMEEFIDLSLEGLRHTLIPGLSELPYRTVNIPRFVASLCSELRYSRKVRDELIAATQTDGEDKDEFQLYCELTRYTAKQHDNSHIDMEMARDIQIALSNFAVKGSFK